MAKKITRIFWIIFTTILVLFLLQLFIISGTHLLETNPKAMDFVAFYTGGSLIHNAPEKLYDISYQQKVQHTMSPITLQNHIFLPFLNPPFVAILFSPLTQLPINTAYAIWLIIQFCLCIGIFIIMKNNLKHITILQKIILAFMLFSYIPILTNLLIGQLSTILCFVLLVSWVSLQKKHEIIAGIILSFLLIKPHFILLPLLAFGIQKRWKILLGMSIGILFLCGISLLLVGANGILQYGKLLAQATNWYGLYGIDIQAQPSLQTAIVIITKSTSLEQIRPLWLITGAFIVIPTLMIWSKRYPLTSDHFSLQMAIVIIAMLLISPHTHFHDLVMLLTVAFLLLIARKTHANQQKKSIIIISTCYMIAFIGYISELYVYHGLRPYWILLTVFSLIVLWLYCISLVYKTRTNT